MNWWVLKRQLHCSWLIAFFSAGVVIGVVAIQFLPPTWFLHTSWLLVAVGLVGVALWKRFLVLVLLAVVAGMLLGLWRSSPMAGMVARYEPLVGYEVELKGVVSEDPELDKKGQLTLQLQTSSINEVEYGGRVWVSTTKGDVKRGDNVMVKGELQPGFGNFAGSLYRAELVRVQRPEPGDVAGQMRDSFAAMIRHGVPEPEASLGIGYLLGQRSSLPSELDEALKTVGLTHIVVASGYNLTILVRFARRAFVKVSKYLAAVTAGGMIIGFMAITGMSPSMSRAGMVAGLSLLAWYYGRKFHPLVLLPFVAAVTLLINPSFGWNDLGWQLSFAAFAGVMILAPLLQAYFFGEKKPGAIRQILGETIAAQLVTLPILVMAFGQFSNVAVVANLLVLPFVPLAMLLTFLTGLGSLIVPEIGGLIGLPTTWLLEYMVHVATYLAQLPWAITQFETTMLSLIGWYVVLTIACWFMWRETKVNLSKTSIIE